MTQDEKTLLLAASLGSSVMFAGALTENTDCFIADDTESNMFHLLACSKILCERKMDSISKTLNTFLAKSKNITMKDRYTALTSKNSDGDTPLELAVRMDNAVFVKFAMTRRCVGDLLKTGNDIIAVAIKKNAEMVFQYLFKGCIKSSITLSLDKLNEYIKLARQNLNKTFFWLLYDIRNYSKKVTGNDEQWIFIRDKLLTAKELAFYTKEEKLAKQERRTARPRPSALDLGVSRLDGTVGIGELQQRATRPYLPSVLDRGSAVYSDSSTVDSNSSTVRIRLL